MSEVEINEIKTKLEELENRVAKLEGLPVTGGNTTKKLSVREFLKSVNPRGDVQKTLAVCYYLEVYENMEFFNVNDVKECFSKAREIVPDNLSDKLYKNAKKGYLMDYKEKKDNLKTYVLTGSGIDHFEIEE